MRDRADARVRCESWYEAEKMVALELLKRVQCNVMLRGLEGRDYGLQGESV